MSGGGVMTDAQRDDLIVHLRVETDVLEAIMIHLLVHLAKQEAEPMAFLRTLSEDLHSIANSVSIPATHDFAFRYLEAHRTKVDQLTQAAVHRLDPSN
jgi:hypothetical protein